MEKEIDLNYIKIKNLKDPHDDAIKYKAEVNLKNGEENLKYEQP